MAKFYQMNFTPCLILSLLVVGRARLDEYRAVRNAVEEVLDVSPNSLSIKWNSSFHLQKGIQH